MRRHVRHGGLAVAAWLLLAGAWAAPPARPAAPYFPPKHPEWERRTPAQAAIDGARLAEAVALAVAGEAKAPRDLALNHRLAYAREPENAPIGPFKERGDPTGLVIRGGYIVAEWGDPARVDMTFSVTKSFLSTVVGLAVDRGLIRSVTDRVEPYVPIPEFASAHNRTITWEHLLRQTSDWEGTLWGKPDWADRPQGEPATWVARPRNEPGTVYKYNDVRVNVLALAALHVWRRPLPQVLRDEVMDPIGASPAWRWHGYENSWVNVDGVMVQSVSGGGHWGGGMWISAYDQARFGLLTLRRGRWLNRQILSDKWIAMATTPTAAEPTYGFMNYFLNTGRKRLPAAPEKSFAHLGAGSNIVYVDPENDLVIVARWIEDKAFAGVVEKVLSAIAAP
jgi:CubicO group peptidase (beta-lactamase class C family)